MTKSHQLILQFAQALARLTDAVRRPKDEYMRDSSIKRFEIAFDIGWKAARAYLQDEKGVCANSPKGVFRALYEQGVIPYEDFWIAMTDMRNQAVHMYDEEHAEKVYAQLPSVVEHLQMLLETIRS